MEIIELLFQVFVFITNLFDLCQIIGGLVKAASNAGCRAAEIVDHHVKEDLVGIKLVLQVIKLVCRRILKLNENVDLVAHPLNNTCNPSLIEFDFPFVLYCLDDLAEVVK